MHLNNESAISGVRELADVKALLDALTLEEKAVLTAGEDMFSTPAVARLNIPKVHVTDGPSGARGNGLPGGGGPPSVCIPCGSAIGATWNPDLAERLGGLVGQEALDRQCRGLLAPTVNLHRSPLAGRNFECYSEDPFLSGHLAAGYVKGVQSKGVFATVKHFVGNDAEFERGSINSVIDERSLRELYLLPFEIAVREGGALAIMTAYNRLNGRWLTQQPEYLLGILREEWGFEGLVMTDWFAVAETATALGAGLDLEMPGPGRALGASVVAAVRAGDLPEAELDAAVSRFLTTLETLGVLDLPEPDAHLKVPSKAELLFLRQAAAESTVLLSNDGVLPLNIASLNRVVVIGPHAVTPSIMGGGSAQVTAHHFDTPLEALVASCGDSTEVLYERGCELSASVAVVGGAVLRAPEGFHGEKFAGTDFEGPVVEELEMPSLRMVSFGILEAGALNANWSVRVAGTVVPEESGLFQIALAQAGLARLFINGELVLDGFTNPAPPGGSDFFGQVSQDLLADVTFERDVPVELVVEYARVDTTLAGFRVGFRTPDSDALLERAVALASDADVSIVFVGTTGDSESEGHDRKDLQLPGRQDELIRRVAAANPRTVVIVNAGAPIDMAWADEVAAVAQCWFGGQEMGPAVAAVLVGAAEPGGRLPTTIPIRLEHTPSHGNFPGENGELRYGEGLFMGYRGFEHSAITPRFPFGHGLSYTSFSFGEPVLSAATYRPGESMTVSLPVTNTGGRAGSEVVQVYIAPEGARLARPLKELKAFAKVWLDAGETKLVDLVLSARSFAYWDPGQDDWGEIKSKTPDMFSLLMPGDERRERGWQVDAGRYDVLIGRSTEEIFGSCRVEISAETSGRLS
jgi:beta-glucosidase